MTTSHSGPCLPPSSSLPPVRFLVSASEEQVNAALRALQSLYCPLRLPVLPKSSVRRKDLSAASGVSTPVPVDSGYVSQDEDDDDEAAVEEMTAAIRADPFERTFVTRWLTSLISRAEEMDITEEAKAQVVDDAAFILSSFSDSTNEEEEEALTREFSFPTDLDASIEVTLNDAPLTGTDHTDVGLQSWGASIVLSSMMCADPERFGLTSASLPERPSIIELGAGTGLVSLTLAKLLPTLSVYPTGISATDYHPTVLANLQENINTNFPPGENVNMPVSAMALDWSMPPPDLESSSELLIAADVVYAPQHAAWLRDCAAHLVTDNGIFWLIVTVRQNGKFEGIPDTVEAAFVPELCPKDGQGRSFKILERNQVEKRKGIGRGDEKGYNLYKIGWF
ncbi:hypothetical protein E8E12_008648 [Didymella heteroderae]|uniref:S-adenosylmethionine-dependent methyltransferase n=1 Tax=Didymella heteroderae TaxID=1769908 RepID=A0A9P5C2U3_9PLEO|nr:hypothetical protein E8E12_008648 [Didymella heteroderae]